MDLRYSVTQASAPPSFDYKKVCAVSCKNIIAFTHVFHLGGDRKKKPYCAIALADLNCPYQSTILASCCEPVQLLKFSDDGCRLLIVTQGGFVRLLEQKSGALQPDFVTISETRLDGETVLAADFLHSGQRPQINLGEVKVNSLYNEKFTLLKHSPSLLGPGGCATDGIIVVTASGLMVVVAIWREEVLETVRRVLGTSRGHYTAADIAFAPDGSVVVAAWRPDVMRCWRVSLCHADLSPPYLSFMESHDVRRLDLHEGDGKLRVRIECCESLCPYRPLPAAAVATVPGDSKMRLDADSTATRELSSGSYRVSDLVFPVREDPSLLLLVLVEKPFVPDMTNEDVKNSSIKSSWSNSYIVQKYRLEEKTQPVFKLFKSSETAAPSPSTVSYKTWVLNGEWISPGRVVGVGACERYLFQPSQLPHAVSVATEDGVVTALNLQSLLPMGCYNLCGEDRKRTTSSPVQSSLGVTSGSSATRPMTVSLAHTWTGLSLVTYDSTGTLCLFSLIKSTDIGNLWPLCVLLLLEYSLVSGQDCWELLINTPPLSVITVVDRLLDTLSLHGPAYHTKFFTRILLLKHAILRLSTSSQHRATEAMIQAQASAILNLFRQLRPVTADFVGDKCASTLLTAYLENRSSLEQPDLDKSIDQYMMGVNQSLDCQVEPRMGKYLQQLIQYTAEVALYLLCSLAQAGKSDFVRDVKTLHFLREILFRGRVLHRQCKLVAPHILRKTDSLDVWAQLYRLLTRLMSVLPAEPDATFIDEVVLLETQVLCRSLSLSMPARGYLASVTSVTQSGGPAAHHASAIHYQHGESDEPPSLSNYQLEGGLPPANPRDPLFLHFIPKDAPKLQCSRCWSVRTAEHEPNSPWEQLWSSTCPCSGHWMPEIRH